MEALLYQMTDHLYVAVDRKHIRRTQNIRWIPNQRHRRGGKLSYAEWAHVIGIFQTLMFLHLQRSTDVNVLDVGCGTGLLAIAAEPVILPHGRYVGLDVSDKDIEFCRGHYPASLHEFIHFDKNNPAYAPAQRNQLAPWPLDSDRFDLVTALSVWTHLNETDALFYFAEVGRVLKPGGKAIITFFLLDEAYRASLSARSPDRGRYHMTLKSNWVFDQPAYGSAEWRCPSTAKIPEQAIAVSTAGLDRLLSVAPLKLEKHYRGNWKELPGVYFQDVLVFEKT
jgi:SAM-dependent methyltransferase